MDDRLTITHVANMLKVTPRTLMRWEKTGKIKKPKRDWRGWRFYTKDDLTDIKKFYEGTYEFSGENKIAVGNLFKGTIAVLLIAANLSLAAPLNAEEPNANLVGVRETPKSVDLVLSELPAVNAAQGNVPGSPTYTLGANDVVSIEVRRHPEFTGNYAINYDGKISYKYVGDISANGLTKDELKVRVTEILSAFLVSPEVDVQIVAYLSKVIYVVGDVNQPGKFYMRGDTILVREALIQAGLPTQAAALRGCRVITPEQTGKHNYRKVDAERLLYQGDLTQDLVMKPGDVLYVPATFMAKVIRVISPVTDVAARTAGTAAAAAAVAL